MQENNNLTVKLWPRQFIDKWPFFRFYKSDQCNYTFSLKVCTLLKCSGFDSLFKVYALFCFAARYVKHYQHTP